MCTIQYFLSICKMLYNRILELIHFALTEFLSKRIRNQDLRDIVIPMFIEALLTIADKRKQLSSLMDEWT